LLLALVGGACGSEEPSPSGAVEATSAVPGTTAVTPTTAVTRDPDQRYTVTAQVLETPTQPATLCLGVIYDSDPPAGCEGIVVAGWDWSTAPGATERRGVRRAEVTVAGTTDGSTFTLTEAPAPAPSEWGNQPTYPETPCPEPAGGWAEVDPGRVTTADWEAVVTAANTAPDLVDSWIVDGAARPPGEPADPTTHGTTLADERFAIGADSLLVYQFSGDVERHERELRALWGGALCVAQRPPYRWTGEQVRDVFFGSGAEEPRAAGVWAIDGTFPGSERPGRSTVDVLVLDGVTQRWVDERFGVGEVTLRGLLTPVP
jgi:hypothetical protein